MLRSLVGSEMCIRDRSQGVKMLVGADPECAGSLDGLLSIDISRNFIDAAGLEALCTHLAKDSVVVTLDISFNIFESTRPITQLLTAGGASNLSHLHLNNNRLGGSDQVADFAALLEVAGASKSISTLNISGCDLGVDNASGLVNLCKKVRPQFETLHVETNPRLTIENAIAMIGSLAHNDCPLRSFRISAPSGDHHPLLKAVTTMLDANHTISDVTCAFGMSVAEEPEVQMIQQLLLLNGMHLRQ
eukprot:TRINITY_DN8351_c0_g1_i2.p1 TRINITY_DN8351_c0_g1~~TRINITY_DN8351_c0_g1_i2.p1  ORF type:complete len:246 (-),score=71.99 TRINITY_DN8351_c0_g1_i2:237-974(-)